MNRQYGNFLTTKLTFALVLLFLIAQYSTYGQVKADWKQINTVEDVYMAYPDQMERLLGALNLNMQGLDSVKQAYESEDNIAACHALLEYYKNCDNARHLRIEQPQPGSKTVAVADTILKDVFVVQNVRGQVPYGEDGHRDWHYQGPNNDREWAWLSNRHTQINSVLDAYFETGNPKYPEYIDLFLRDFIIKSLPYPGVKSSNSIWRGLEVAARAKVWSYIFYSLLNSDYLSPATRLLMLSSLPDHAHYNRNFHGGNNWLTMEISALATIATNFPEFRESGEWLEYSISTMTSSMTDQVYADGVQTELTSHYHNVALRNFLLFKNICDRASKPLPDFYTKTLELMYGYLAGAMRPDGHRVLNNDGDRGSDREIVLDGARLFHHPEWEYIATNGSSGTVPGKGPSSFFPWAGQLISRDGYDEDAQWSFFDVGPWGSGHQHNDMMHISISAYGRDLLVDAGRFAYTGAVADKFRGYARSTKGHNTILIDGKGQKPGVKVADQPLPDHHFVITSDFDYAWNSFEQYEDIENVRHARSLMYVRGQFWVVIDQIDTDQPRTVDALWHWHPGCEVQELKKSMVSSQNNLGNLKIVPVGKQHWDISFIKGQEDPEIQGWYSKEYNQYEPNTASIFSTTVETSQAFVWLLVPFETTAPVLKVKKYRVLEDGVSIRVRNHSIGEWDLFIPYANSRQVKFDFNEF